MAIAFVAKYVSAAFNNTSTKTITPTIALGDFLVIVGATSNFSTSEPFNTPSGTGLTVTSQQTLFNGATYNDLHLWTATVTSAGSPVVSLSTVGAANTDTWAFGIYRYSGVNAVGTSVAVRPAANGSTASITTGVANALVFLAMNDFNGTAGLPTANTSAGAYTNETNLIDSGQGSLYAGHYLSVGAAGAKTVGTSAPTTAWTIIAVELQPKTGAVEGGYAALGMSGSATGAKVTPDAGASALGLAGSATGKKVVAQGGTAALSVAGYAIAARKAPQTGTAAMGLATTGTAARHSITRGTAAVGLATTGTAARKAPAAGSGALGLAGRATAAKAAPQHGSAALGLAGKAAGVKAAPQTGRSAMGLAGAGHDVHVAPLRGTSSLGLSASSSDTHIAALRGTSALGLSGRAITPDPALPAAVACLGLSGVGQARKVAAQTGRVHVGLSGVGAARRAVPAAGVGVLALCATGTALVVPPRVWPPRAHIVVLTEGDIADTELTDSVSHSTVTLI